MSIPELDPGSNWFPDPESAVLDPNGLLAWGGDLSPARLEAAYRTGIFPWYSIGQPILWWSPDPRMVLFPDELHISRSMRRCLNSGRFRVTLNQDFRSVIEGCAAPRSYADDTWIIPSMQAAYRDLHAMGLAHSVECWKGDQLVGGLYGIGLGRLFFGESMFSRATNASKTVFVLFVQHLQRNGFRLMDCQLPNEHLSSLGAREIPRTRFLELLGVHQHDPVSSDVFARQELRWVTPSPSS